MTGDELRQALRELGMTRLECATKLGVWPETVSRWISGARKRKLVPGPAAMAVIRWLNEKRSSQDGTLQPFVT